MANPWEQYATQNTPEESGPWSSYASPSVPENPLGADATPAQVIRNAAMGRIDRKQAEDYLRSVGMEPAVIDQFGQDASGFDKALGIAQKPAQGLLSGFSEEVMTPPMAALGSAVTGQPYSALRDAAIERSRMQMDVAAKQNPYVSGGLEIGGAITGGVGAATALPNLAKGVSQFAARGLLPTMLTSGAVGAGSGGLYATGTGEGSLSQRLQQAQDSAVAGGVVGALVPFGFAVAGPLTRMVASMLGRRSAQPATQVAPVAGVRDIAERVAEVAPAEQLSQNMAAKVGQAIRRDFPEQAQDVITTLKADQGSLLDTYSAKIRQLAKGASQYAGGQQVMEDYFAKKIPQTYDDIQRSISQNISGDAAYYATVDDIANAGRAKAAPLYDKAYAQLLPTSDNTSAMFTVPEVQNALNKAYRTFPSELKDVAPNSIKALDYAKRMLDDEISTAQRAGENNLARSRTSVKNALVEAMDAASPAYAQARKQAGDYIRLQNAMDMGKGFMREDPELVTKAFKSLSDTEKTAYRAGVAKAIRDIADKAREGVNPYAAIMGSEANKKRLAAVLNPEQYRNFVSDMKATDRMFKMRNEILGGSPTASKTVAAQEVAEMGNFLESVKSKDFTSAITGWIARRFDGLRDETAKNLAQIITEERPAQKLAIFDEMMRGKGLTKEERQLAKRAFVLTDKAFGEYKTGATAGAGVLGAKTGEVQ